MFLKPFIRSASARSSSSSSGSGLDLNNAVCTLLSIPGPRQYPIVGTLPSYWWPKYDKLRYNKGTWPMSSLDKSCNIFWKVQKCPKIPSHNAFFKARNGFNALERVHTTILKINPFLANLALFIVVQLFGQ